MRFRDFYAEEHVSLLFRRTGDSDQNPHPQVRAQEEQTRVKPFMKEWWDRLWKWFVSILFFMEEYKV